MLLSISMGALRGSSLLINIGIRNAEPELQQQK